MSKILKHYLAYFSIAITLLAFAVVVYTGVNGKYQNTTFRNSYTVYSTDGWTVSDSSGNSSEFNEFPYDAGVKKGQTYTLTTTLPEIIPEDYSVMLYTNYSKVNVYVNEQQINSYAVTQPLPIGRLVGNIRLISKLTPEMAGGTLNITFTPYYDNCSTINPIIYGNTEALKLSVIYSNLWRLILSSVLLAISLICISIFIFHEMKRNVTMTWSFCHLGAFLFYISLWFICSSDLPQLFTNANETVSLISFLSLSIMGIHFAGYCESTLTGGKKYFKALQFIGWIVPLIELLGYVTTWWDPPEVIFLNHLYIAVVLVSSFIFVTIEPKKTVVERLFIVAIIVMIISVVTCFVFYYSNPTGGYDAMSLGIGILIFSATLFLMILWKEVKFIEERKSVDIYRELAYKDPLTGLGNRGAFDKKFVEISDNATDKTLVQLILLDLNRLKQVNDNIGHDAGDTLIISAANCIYNAFSKDAECFRIGGDEYAVLCKDQPEQLEQDINTFERLLNEYNILHKDSPISISIGYETQTWSSDENFFRDLFKAADRKMYADKKLKHSQMDTIKNS